MSDHFVQLTIQSGGLHPAFVCTTPVDAACRRRPDDFEDGARESWSAEEATKAGYPCWAVEWVEAVGLPDAIFAHPDGVLVSVPVEIRYSEGVEVTPTIESGDQPLAPASDPDHHAERYSPDVLPESGDPS